MKKKFILSLIILSLFSVVNNYYARYYLSSYSNYYIKQLLWFIVGYLILFILNKINVNYILNKSKYLYIIGNVLLIITLLFGRSVNGSKSWLCLFGISFQVSELMKIFLILYLRYITINSNLSDFKYIIYTFIIVLIPSILVFLQPDTGPIISYIIIYITYLFLRKLNKKYYISFIFIILIILMLLIYCYLFNKDILIKVFGSNIFYRLDRISLFINSEGYQIEQALKSISLSGYFGIKKRVYFPEAATDFAITLLIANFGLVGLIIYFICYIVFIYSLSSLCNDRYIIKPTINYIIVQSIINLLMNIGLFPIVGITYPLLSYGGSSIVSTFILIGIIYNMDYSCIHHSSYNQIDC